MQYDICCLLLEGQLHIAARDALEAAFLELLDQVVARAVRPPDLLLLGLDNLLGRAHVLDPALGICYNTCNE
jgi:hypothetical protein